jgi:hypothetical protein
MADHSPLSSAEFCDGSYHFPTGPSSPKSKACLFYNTSTCLKGAACTFRHSPDEKSLRLVLDGPNICKNHLLGEQGCEFFKKGRKCWYSHDLTKANIPLYDKNLLKRHLVQLEAQIYTIYNFEWYAALLEKESLLDQGKITQEECEVETEKIDDDGVVLTLEWMTESRRRVEEAIEQAERGDIIPDINEGKPHVFNVKGLSGVEILRLCGVEAPFAAQKERKAISRIGGELLDDDYGDPSGFSEEDMFELACQGVKPWDDDAAFVLAALSSF